ncbi:MAG TPA: prolyl oligopeptidase family serine peptidase [Saprospiraceae bacterium]|nr:prolyl oligopeptidase family serine peptidase [Saprospiraceae bacterium]
MQKLITTLCLLLITGTAFAQFTIEQVLSSPFPSDLIATENDNTIAWVFNDQGRRNIWMADLDDNTAQQLTDFPKDDGQAISDLTFDKMHNRIVFIRGGAPNRRGEIPNPTSDPDGAERLIMTVQMQAGVFLDTIGSGSSLRLSPDGQLLAFIRGGQVWFHDMETEENDQAFTIRGSAGNLSWSPSGQKLAFVSRRGDHGFIGIYDRAADAITYIAPSVDQDGSPVWSPDGGQLAFIRQPNQKAGLPFMPRREALPWSIWRHDLKSEETIQLWQASKGPGSAFRSISAENQLFWMADNTIVFPYEGEGWTQLYGIPAAGGPAKWMTPGAFEVQFASITPDGKHILYSSNQGDIDRQHIWRVSSTQSPQKISGDEGIQWSPVQTGEGNIAALASSGTMPAHVVRIQEEELEMLAEETLPEDFPSKELVEPEQVIFPASDGMMIHGQLFKPSKMKRNERYPALLFFHGGSRRQMLLGFHHRGYYHNAYALNQYLASQGYIVLSVNYRSGIGYGMEFREALNYGARGASEFNDVMGAGLYLKNREDVDGENIGLWGGSYGGYLTALGLAKASDLFAAGVDIHGVHDWNVVIKNFVPGYDAAMAEEVATLALQSSPMPYVSDWTSPVLFIHGDDDRNVPFSETVDVVEALRRKTDTHFEQLIFPDEVHGFLLHRNWLKAYEATADFFDRMLKDQ